jgi:hypothetical protein
MARTKQTARRATGGKAPRHPANTAANLIQEEKAARTRVPNPRYAKYEPGKVYRQAIRISDGPDHDFALLRIDSVTAEEMKTIERQEYEREITDFEALLNASVVEEDDIVETHGKWCSMNEVPDEDILQLKGKPLMFYNSLCF